MSVALRKARVGIVVATAALLGLAGTVDAQALDGDRARASSAVTVPSAAAAVDYETWKADVTKVIDGEARPYLEQRIQNGGGQKQAIVLDIDNTSLETYFQLFPPTPAVQPVLDLAKYANEHGVGVFFITARPDVLDDVTRGNLKYVDYPITGLYQRPLGDIFGDAAEFKTAKRAEIESLGYTIIANIGNNTSDLVGGHAERTFKLPDYDGQLS
ncbi:HAD family acid phosphatase [Streptomyces luomodiensis]|uniref:HAD family acid phosphatase n=1 Tax=Streptomyces luomodiensis TaxID=3026192 RepID=A0ABY9UQA9_9ACTN|nr:HAD family acid phosphatase [Streptomyces sp. SCA4-21]WNE94162.1 HAD family acid phosphatase [Streptomyces sp. SCA4-21]